MRHSPGASSSGCFTGWSSLTRMGASDDMTRAAFWVLGMLTDIMVGENTAMRKHFIQIQGCLGALELLHGAVTTRTNTALEHDHMTGLRWRVSSQTRLRPSPISSSRCNSDFRVTHQSALVQLSAGEPMKIF